ncbi:hypothetical protein FDJ25_gp121 [Vibrio phage Aphrodite1]|uniref:Uncharacterized protein n=1 Tax=Vibrio phage Aphrodite1 TaxID=2070057 RepID=A0A2I7QI69_9CAUD|nr:hypothetical protein FDJ25_gp121 [Vibrio phage Aphrodite1]AUR81091.1 hypothetical protein Aphrodite1_0081 [Vibrio phage Aphrodite1]
MRLFNCFKKKPNPIPYENVARLLIRTSPEEELTLRVTRYKELYYVNVYDIFRWSDGTWYNQYENQASDEFMISALNSLKCEFIVSEFNNLIHGTLLLDHFECK